MRIRNWILCLAAAVAIGGGGYGLHRYLASSAQGSEYREFTATFEADKETKEALDRYQSGKYKPAQLLKPGSSDSKVVYVYFCGLPDRPLAERIVDILEKKEGTAAFFVEGQNAMDEEEVMKLLHKKGHLLGNYTWLGRPSFEKLDTEEALRSLCLTQKAIRLMGGDTPTYFKAPNTKYTDEVLKEAGAAGLRYVVESTLTIKRGQLKSRSDAEEIAKKIKPGNILAFEINRPLDIRVKEQGKYDEKPAIDKKPTVKDDITKEEVKKDTTAQQIEWLIESLTEEGYKLQDLKYAVARD